MTTIRPPTRLDLQALACAWPLWDQAGTRALEQALAATLPAHALMQRAGLAVARLAQAVAPHAQRVWIAAGPGNNGGDGLEAAMHLAHAGKHVRVRLLGDDAKRPADATASLLRANQAGVVIERTGNEPWGDIAIDALLGIGARRATTADSETVDALTQSVNRHPGPRLSIDIPSGLDANTGQPLGEAVVQATHTLALLCLKPGLFTGLARDHIGELWFDDLGCTEASNAVPSAAAAPCARLAARCDAQRVFVPRAHASHKGTWGGVIVVGGAVGMEGAARLAGRAALAAGAGRVWLSPLDESTHGDAAWPELMWRPRIWHGDLRALADATVVCGCGGGLAVREALPAAIAHSARLVLDADALNATANDAGLQTQLKARGQRGRPTVLTPHPLEAARLLDAESVSAVQVDRLGAAKALAQRFGAVVVLKGSGSVIAAPDRPSVINTTGNARLATAGTGDVLAGWLAGLWARQNHRATVDAYNVAVAAVWQHGAAAGHGALEHPMRASQLIEALASGSNLGAGHRSAPQPDLA